jgi:branched-chain amino acid transport system ATP-binding protein
LAWPDEGSEPQALLEVEGLKAGYGPQTVVFEAGFRVRPGEVVAMMGHNGAGKSTTVKTVFGLVKPRAGTVRYAGQEVTGHNCRQNVAAGMSYTPADSFVFADLSVSDNLKLGALSNRSEPSRTERLEQVLRLFPILEERAGQRAGTFSGGQQRMLSIGIALMSNPKLMLLDEPSLGLSPALVEQVLRTIRELADAEDMGVLLVEQNMKYALDVADRVVIMHSGRIRLDATADEIRERGQWWDLF